MKTIRVRNYRSIVDSGDVELKPITAVVGKNSSGKSSFIRIFPLLKQTLERPVSESLLWYGDYVDLGDYKNITSRYTSDDMEIHFTIDVNSNVISRYSDDSQKIECKVGLTVKKAYFSKIDICFGDQNIQIFLGEDGKIDRLLFNDVDSEIDPAKYWWNRTTDLLPSIYVREETERYSIFRIFSEGKRKQLQDWFVKHVFPEDMDVKNVYFMELFMIADRSSILNRLKDINPKKFNDFKVTYKRFLKINNIMLELGLNIIFESISNALSAEMDELKYMKPIRALVDRYYRVQGVRVDEIDSDGSNVPMILHTMQKGKLREFENWSKEAFGVVFSVAEKEGHVSLVIRKNVEDDTSVNLADTGYGYSQMLPIVMLMWMIHEEDSKKYRLPSVKKIIIIEQPELHLHPAYQAKMMDVFVNIVSEAKKMGIEINVIFETHSETMINRLGALIYKKNISKEDVNILVFEKQDSYTSIESKGFDDDGLLKGWPIDFFSPEGEYSVY